MPPKASSPQGETTTEPPSAAPSSPLTPPRADSTPRNGDAPGEPGERSASAPTDALAEAAEPSEPEGQEQPVIDPELADLPAPPHHLEPGTLSITESILQAPNPRPADFSMMPITGDVDVADLSEVNLDGPPGSPTAKLLKAIAPPNAAQPDNKWPPPPPNASVNLFIGRALLSNGNDNWPLKPNDIVNWIRKHYPSEWDGDEGRCSAHRVRTYLARKGADMYYEKLNQGTIAGWRIRQNHLWRFENGGFLGRGMKQEEAIAAQAKENEAIATAAHKASAAAALAAGHPGVKVSMSAPGINDGPPPPKKPRPSKTAGQARRRNIAIKGKPEPATISDIAGDLSLAQAQAAEQHAFYDTSVNTAHDEYNPASSYDPTQAGPSSAGLDGAADPIDPNLMGSGDNGDNTVDMDMVQRAMQAAAANAGQMEDLEMGMQLPIEMQMHGGEHDDRGDWAGTHHPYTPHGAEYGFTGTDGQVYGHTNYGAQ